ncbi:MAG: J domain-containing protein [Spirochaetaceae bacterium]
MSETHAPMESVIRELIRRFETAGTWYLTADDIRRLLGLDHATYYRRIYQAAQQRGGTVELSTATARFGPENAGELVDLLELFVGREAEDALTRLGAFLPHEHRVELTQTLLETAHEWVQAHRLDHDTFRRMLRVFGSFERARDTYLNEFFPQAELLEAAAKRFVERRPVRLPEIGRATAYSVLHRLFRRHVFEFQTVFAAIGVELFEIAVAAGFVRRPEEEYAERGETAAGAGVGSGADGGHGRGGPGDRGRRSTDGDGAKRGSSPVVWACHVMELDPRNLSPDAVKRNYKRLMRRYHPDVNPRGLRTAQRVNRAYSLLLDAV